MTAIQVHPARTAAEWLSHFVTVAVCSSLPVTAGAAVCPGVLNILKQRSEGTRQSTLMPNTQPSAESPLGT